LEAEWAKVKAQQAKEPLLVLSMNAMAKALKVLQGLVLNESKTNAQLFLGLKGSQKKGGQTKQGSRKGHEDPNVKSFHKKKYKGKKG